MKSFYTLIPIIFLSAAPVVAQQHFLAPNPVVQTPATVAPAPVQPAALDTPPPLPRRNLTPPPLPVPETRFYVEENGRGVGPFSFGQVRERILEGRLKRTDLVWRTGLTEWVDAKNIGEFRSLFDQARPPDIPIDQRFKRLVAGVWQSEEYNPTMYNTTRTRIRYNIDGSFSGTQTTRVGGMNMPISVPVQGTWQITVVSEKEFLMTIIAKGEVFPTSANLLIIDQNTLQDKDKGILVTRVPR